jgi:hypothetical protein
VYATQHMRRVLLTAVAIALGGSLALPGASGAQIPTQDSVTGSAAAGEGRQSVDFTFDVHSGPSGESPTGTVSFDAFLADLGDLEVSCLTVNGNRASMIVLIPPLSPSAPAGVLISVEDNDGAAPDGLSWRFLDTLPTACPVPSAVGEPIRSGNVIVTDARPFPTSKEQCKHGGWRSFGAFKSQGDCVSFVRQRARQACIFERVGHGVPAFRAKYGIGVHQRHAMRRCIRQRIGG